MLQSERKYPWQPPLQSAVNLCSHKVLVFTMSDNHTYAWDLKWGRMCLGANTTGVLPRRDVKISSLWLYLSNLISSMLLLGQGWSNILWHNWSKSQQGKKITKPSSLTMSNSYLQDGVHKYISCAALNYPVELINLLWAMTCVYLVLGLLMLLAYFNFFSSPHFMSQFWHVTPLSIYS